jgi:hypothetical protein
MAITEKNVERVLRLKGAGLSAAEALASISTRDDAAETSVADVEAAFAGKADIIKPAKKVPAKKARAKKSKNK